MYEIIKIWILNGQKGELVDEPLKTLNSEIEVENYRKEIAEKYHHPAMDVCFKYSFKQLNNQ